MKLYGMSTNLSTKHYKYSLLLFLGIFLSACGDNHQSDLIGTWKAHQVLEENEPLSLNPEEIRFDFSNTGDYHFTSTLNYQEAGRYYLEKELLYTLDTLNQESIEKVVQIQFLSPDTIQLKMQHQGKDRTIELSKQQ